MSAHQLTWKSAWTCNNADTIKAAVAAGIGVSVISQMAVAKEAKAGELLIKTIEGVRFDRQYKIVYHKNKYLSKAMENFIESVPGTISELMTTRYTSKIIFNKRIFKIKKYILDIDLIFY